MARLLENQARELLRESNTMAGGDVEGFAAVAFPIVRRVFAGLIANDLVSVQPMSLPSGLIFFLDFTNSIAAGKTFNAVTKGSNIPEIDIKVDSQLQSLLTTKKLKAKWTPELGQDLNAYHNLDAEVELTSILSEQIALEIDREILADLVNGATAAKFYWSRAPGQLFVKRYWCEIGALLLLLTSLVLFLNGMKL
jgi:hypothetical protein